MFHYFSRVATNFPLIFFSFLLYTPSWASDYHTPRLMGLGGSGHAGPILNESIYVNPSFISFLKAYSLSSSYYFFTASDQAEKGRGYSISIQDGRTEIFQAGVALAVRNDGLFVHFGGSRAIIDRLGVGIGGKFFIGRTRGISAKETTFSVSGIPTDWFQTSLIIDNMLELQESRDNGLYREIIVGTKFNVMSIFMLYLDPHWTPSLSAGEAWGLEAGVEFTLMRDLFLRLGHFQNANVPLYAARGRGMGFGLGWVGPKIAIDYGLQRVFQAKNHRPATAHHFGFSIYF